MVDGAQSEIPTASRDASDDGKKRAELEKRDKIKVLEAQIDQLLADPSLNQDQKNKLLAARASLSSGGLDVNLSAIDATVQTAEDAVSASRATASYELAGNVSTAQQEQLNATVNERVNRCARHWNIDSPKELRDYTNAIIDEPDKQFKAYRSEHLAQEIERNPELKAATRAFTEAPKSVQVAVIKTEVTTDALLAAEEKKYPKGSSNYGIFAEARRYSKSPEMSAATSEYEKDHDLGKFNATVKKQHTVFVRNGDDQLQRDLRSDNPTDRKRAGIALSMGGTEGAIKRSEGLTPELQAQAKRDSAANPPPPLDPNSDRAKNAAAVATMLLTQDTYDTMARAANTAVLLLVKTKSPEEVHTYFRDFDHADKSQQVEMARKMMMADTQASSMLKKLTPEAQTQVLGLYVDQVEHNTSNLAHTKHLNTGLAAAVVREKAEEQHIKLDGSNKFGVAQMMMGEGFSNIIKGDQKTADFWASTMEHALKHNGMNKTEAAAIGTVLHYGAAIGTTIVKNGTAVVAATANYVINPGKALADGAIGIYNYFAPAPEKPKEHTGPSLQQEQAAARRMMDTNHDGKVSAAELAAARNEADKNHDGKVSAAELAAYLKEHPAAAAAKAGADLKQMQSAAHKIMDKNHDGKVDASELAAARKAADTNHDGKVDVKELGAYLKAHGVTIGTESNSIPQGAKPHAGKGVHAH